MNARTRVGMAIALFLFSAAFAENSFAEHKPWPRRPGVVLYHMKDNASAAERSTFGQMLGRHRTIAVSAIEAVKSYHALAFPTGVGDEETVAEELKASGAVDFAEPDYLMPAAAVPDDPQYGSQWFHQTINSQAAWTYTTGSASVLVAICDTGIDATHPDLIPNLSLPGYNVVNHTQDTSPVASHGTAMAGIMGAVGNNAIGIAGMNWGIKILPVRITNNADSSAWCSDMASGIEWAADHGAKVINLSYETLGCPATIEAASHYARSLGSLVVVAAGNDAQDISKIFPAVRSFILVGATDTSDHETIFSNYGNGVDLGAPGVSIFTTLPGGYGTGTGTSFSAPLVAGVAALIYSLNPSWTPAIVENLILSSAKSMGSSMMGYGRLDAGAALAAAQNCLSGNCPVPAPLNNLSNGGQPPATVNASSVTPVRAYPNPWRSDKHASLLMTIDHLAPGTDVKIFTISARQVRRLTTDSTGAAAWDLNNDSGEHVASGIYLFLAKDSQGQSATGKLAIIR